MKQIARDLSQQLHIQIRTDCSSVKHRDADLSGQVGGAKVINHATYPKFSDPWVRYGKLSPCPPAEPL
jgi:hypothetical protein